MNTIYALFTLQSSPWFLGRMAQHENLGMDMAGLAVERLRDHANRNFVGVVHEAPLIVKRSVVGNFLGVFRSRDATEGFVVPARSVLMSISVGNLPALVDYSGEKISELVAAMGEGTGGAVLKPIMHNTDDCGYLLRVADKVVSLPHDVGPEWALRL